MRKALQPFAASPLILAAALFSVAVVTVACGGKGGSSLPSQAQSNADVSGKAVMLIPSATTSSIVRKAQFLSASAVSVGVTVNGGPATYSNVSATSSLCTAVATGRSCAIPLNAPAGVATFVFTLYGAANGAGKALGVGTATETVVLGTAFTVPVAVGGIVANIAVSVPPIEVGPTSVPVTVTARDADGNTIIGSDPYSSSITLANSDTTGTLTLSTGTVASPSTTVLLAYNGAALPSAASISATTVGVPASQSSPAAVLPLNYFPTNVGRTFEISSFTSPGPAVTGLAGQAVVGNASFDGLTNVQQITQYNPVGFMGAFGLGSTSTTYAIVQNGAFDDIGYSYGPTSTYQPPACSLGEPYGNTGVQTATSGTQQYSQGFVHPVIPFSVTPATFVVAYTGTDSTTIGPPPGSGSLPALCFPQASPPPTTTISTAVTQDASGNFTQLQSFSDGSTLTEHDNDDGSGSYAYVAGTTPGGGASWDNAMPSTWSAANETISAPSGGTVTVTVSQSTSGGVNTGSGTIPVATMYPNGVPTALWSGSSSAGTPVSTLPPQCAVTANYGAPVVPITLTFSRWEPAAGSVTTQNYVDYLAPAIGIICETQTYQQEGDLPNFALSSLPLAVASSFVLAPYLYTEVDSLMTVGSPQSVNVAGGNRLRASFRRRPLP